MPHTDLRDDLHQRVCSYTNVLVTFTITSGPRFASTNYSTLTDSNGVACFTYIGNGGLGTDYITASYMNKFDHVITSGTVTKLWQGACINTGCSAVQCLSDGTWTYNFLHHEPEQQFARRDLPVQRPNECHLHALPHYLCRRRWVPGSPPISRSHHQRTGVTHEFVFQPRQCIPSLGKPPAMCSIPECLSLSACCNHVVTNSLTWVSTVGLVSTYNYSITLQNVTGKSPVKYVGFGVGQSCVSFLPPLIDLTLPAYGGPSQLLPSQTRTVNLQVKRTAPCPGTNDFYLSTLDSNLVQLLLDTS